jgi:hypothetical protein
MLTLREQFEYQLDKAKVAASYKGIDLDIVMVTKPNCPTRISVLGNAISRAAYSIWKQQGYNVRKLCVVPANANPNAKQNKKVLK